MKKYSHQTLKMSEFSPVKKLDLECDFLEMDSKLYDLFDYDSESFFFSFQTLAFPYCQRRYGDDDEILEWNLPVDQKSFEICLHGV